MRFPKHTALVLGLGITMMAATGCARRAYTRTVYSQPSGVYVASAPPPPPATRVTVQPAAPYGGAVWVQGHYQWNGAQYVWVQGHYVQQRAGYQFVQPRWVNRGGRYTYQAGGWGRNGRVVHVYQPQRRYYRPRARVVQRRVVQPRARVQVRGRRGGVRVGYRRRPVRRRGVRVRARRGAVVIRP